MIFKVDKNTFINYNEKNKTAEVLFKSKIEADLEVEQNNIKQQLSDKELIAWAKANVPKESNEKVDILKTTLESINNAKEVKGGL